jgi:hypothetical protein
MVVAAVMMPDDDCLSVLQGALVYFLHLLGCPVSTACHPRICLCITCSKQKD